MCNSINSSIKLAVATVVASLTNQGVMFTAYDVTSILRTQNIPDLPKHYVLKEAIHDLFNNMEMDRSYIRTQCWVNGNKMPSAFVYHPAMSDPATYDPTALGAVAAPASTPATPAVVSTPASVSTPAAPVSRNTNLKSNTVKADSRGRVHVPSSYLDAIGLGAYDTAFVQNLGGVIHIFKKAQPNASNLKSQQVDCYRNLKVAVGPNKAGTSYKFVTNPTAGQITIS